jgi:hypothetical protein
MDTYIDTLLHLVRFFFTILSVFYDVLLEVLWTQVRLGVLLFFPCIWRRNVILLKYKHLKIFIVMLQNKSHCCINQKLVSDWITRVFGLPWEQIENASNRVAASGCSTTNWLAPKLTLSRGDQQVNFKWVHCHKSSDATTQRAPIRTSLVKPWALSEVFRTSSLSLRTNFHDPPLLRAGAGIAQSV